jgi:hypothetical protein
MLATRLSLTGWLYTATHANSTNPSSAPSSWPNEVAPALPFTTADSATGIELAVVGAEVGRAGAGAVLGEAVGEAVAGDGVGATVVGDAVGEAVGAVAEEEEATLRAAMVP